MRYKRLLECKAEIIEPLCYFPAREKASGRMYEGKGKLKVGQIEFFFGLWWHGPDEMPTVEKIQEEISLKGIRYEEKYYDLFWTAFMTEEEIWLHPKGWFGDEVLKKEVEKLGRLNYNITRNKIAPTETLKKLGFVRIL